MDNSFYVFCVWSKKKSTVYHSTEKNLIVQIFFPIVVDREKYTLAYGVLKLTVWNILRSMRNISVNANANAIYWQLLLCDHIRIHAPSQKSGCQLIVVHVRVSFVLCNLSNRFMQLRMVPKPATERHTIALKAVTHIYKDFDLYRYKRILLSSEDSSWQWQTLPMRYWNCTIMDVIIILYSLYEHRYSIIPSSPCCGWGIL